MAEDVPTTVRSFSVIIMMLSHVFGNAVKYSRPGQHAEYRDQLAEIARLPDARRAE